MEKPEPIFTRNGDIISFRVRLLDSISLESAKILIKALNFSINDLQICYYQIGRPSFIKIEETLEKMSPVFYREDEIQWEPTIIEY